MPLPSPPSAGNRSRRKIDAGVDLADDLIKRCLGGERVADQRDIDAVRHRPLGKQRKDLLCAVLPVAAVDEQERRRVRRGLEKIDAVTLARAVAEVEMVGKAVAQFCRPAVPAGDDVGAAPHGLAVVEAAVPCLLAHCPPVRRVKRRCHAKTSKLIALPWDQ
jgi:hypothetical protein